MGAAAKMKKNASVISAPSKSSRSDRGTAHSRLKSCSVRRLKTIATGKAQTNEIELLKIVDASNPRTRRVSFADQMSVKGIRRIPRKLATDVWYTAVEMDRFRMDVLNCKDLRFKVKLKSARCHNHMRRVLLEYRVNKGGKGKKPVEIIGRNSENLSILSMKSSKEPKEAALKKASALHEELSGEDAFMITSLSSACFGPSHRWVFDYYLGSMLDTICTVI